MRLLVVAFGRNRTGATVVAAALIAGLGVVLTAADTASRSEWRHPSTSKKSKTKP
jgi:hypothetical protein